MPRRVSEEVRIMEAFRALPEEKREVVLNLAIAEFRAAKKTRPAKKKSDPAVQRAARVVETLGAPSAPPSKLRMTDNAVRPTNGELYPAGN